MSDQKNKLLRTFLRESFLSLNENKTFLTTENEELSFGSSSHVNVYDTLLSELNNVRKQLSRTDRKERDRITRCMESLRELKKKAHRYGLSTGQIELIEESED
tara:strand:+ start:1888 stop:2196 length:309 start_codon:yes stop_codon:yes gene_type:complete